MTKSREFDNILNECLERLLRGETHEECLGRYPEHRDELRPLLETALLARRVSEIRPGQEFRELARQRFHAVLHETDLKPQRRPFAWLRQPQWAVAVSVALVLLLGGGTVWAANGSMPDEPLYAVKLAVEQTRVALTPSALGKAELYSRLADRRVDEIAQMAAENKPEEIEQAAGQLDATLSRVAALFPSQRVAIEMMAPAARTGPTTPAVPTTPTTPTLPAVPAAPPAPTPPAPTTPPAEKAFGTLAAAPEEETPAADVKTAEGRDTRKAKLKEKVSENAARHSMKLQELLQSAPEQARAALQHALTVSQEGYERALQSLGDP